MISVVIFFVTLTLFILFLILIFVETRLMRRIGERFRNRGDEWITKKIQNICEIRHTVKSMCQNYFTIFKDEILRPLMLGPLHRLRKEMSQVKKGKKFIDSEHTYNTKRKKQSLYLRNLSTEENKKLTSK